LKESNIRKRFAKRVGKWICDSMDLWKSFKDGVLTACDKLRVWPREQVVVE